MISLRLNEKAEQFRAEFQRWLQSNPPPTIKNRKDLDEFVEVSTQWQRKLASERWIAVHWPERFGGRGLSLVEEAIVQEVLASVRAPQLVNLFGLTMVGPVLIQHGTPEQQAKFLPKILTAEEIWCQGFSEPEAGSDLAALRTVGELTSSGGWKINGQKIWTSFAQYAAWCFVLVRTDSTKPKHKGLSYLLVPMSSAGITIRPLTQITGEQEFNEVFFEDVEVEPQCIVGNPGEGWKIAISTLMYERVILTFSRHLQSETALDEIRELLLKKPKDEKLWGQYGRLRAKTMAVRALALNHLSEYSENHPPGPEGSLDKLFWSETFQEICEFALLVLGKDAVFTSAPFSPHEGIHTHRYLYSRGRTIAAGTSEIQRNIIAERLLGLPREER